MTTNEAGADGSLRVLLLDDSEIGLRFQHAVLALDGFDVRPASRLAEFRAILRDWRPDAVLADVRMPDGDGSEICREIKSRPETSHVAVVLFSSLPDNELAALARECGADEYISKQEDARSLGTRIRDVIGAVGRRR